MPGYVLLPEVDGRCRKEGTPAVVIGSVALTSESIQFTRAYYPAVNGGPNTA